MATLTVKQRDMFNELVRRNASPAFKDATIFVQGATFRTAESLVRKGLAKFEDTSFNGRIGYVTLVR